MALPQIRSYVVRRYDRAMLGLEELSASTAELRAITPAKRG
jgi:hypothetical protein